MIRHVALVVPLATLLAVTLAGCGLTGCPSETADLNPPSSATCSLAPSTTAIITVGICAKCSETVPECLVEQRGETFHLDPLVHKCAENQGCDTSSGCVIANSVTCSLQTPSTLGTYTFYVGGVGGYQETFTVDGSGSSTCTL